MIRFVTLKLLVPGLQQKNASSRSRCPQQAQLLTQKRISHSRFIASSISKAAGCIYVRFHVWSGRPTYLSEDEITGVEGSQMQ
jgi:hypothetical protein